MIDPMIELTSADHLQNERGELFTFHGIQGMDPRKLKGQDVRINGVVRHVIGVETFAIYDATGTSFGLAVAPIS